MNREAIMEALERLEEALAVCQCAEDSATEERIKRALCFVNGTLCNIALTLESAANE